MLFLVITRSSSTEDIRDIYSDGLDTLLKPLSAQSAPLGDILGSVFSKIPELKRASQIGPLDDGKLGRDLMRAWPGCKGYFMGVISEPGANMQPKKSQQQSEMQKVRNGLFGEFRGRIHLKVVLGSGPEHFSDQFVNKSHDVVILTLPGIQNELILQNFWEKVRPGGVMVGILKPGSKSAVDAFFSSEQAKFSNTKYEGCTLLVHEFTPSNFGENTAFILRKPPLRPGRTDLRGFEHRDLFGSLLEEEGCHVGAEIGISQGVFAARTLGQWPSCTRYYAIDLWAHQANYSEAGNKPNSVMEVYYKRSVQNMAPYSEKVKVLRMLSSKAVENIADGELDYIYIDARHDYCGVKEDLDNYIPKVKSGGIVAGHDYMDAETFANISHHLEDWALCGNGTVHPGAVKGAVDEAAASLGVELFVLYKDGPFPSWLFRKP